MLNSIVVWWFVHLSTPI